MPDSPTELRAAEEEARERLVAALDFTEQDDSFLLDSYVTLVERRVRAETAERLYVLYIDSALREQVRVTLDEMMAGIEPTLRSELRRIDQPPAGAAS